MLISLYTDFKSMPSFENFMSAYFSFRESVRLISRTSVRPVDDKNTDFERSVKNIHEHCRGRWGSAEMSRLEMFPPYAQLVARLGLRSWVFRFTDIVPYYYASHIAMQYDTVRLELVSILSNHFVFGIFPQ